MRVCASPPSRLKENLMEVLARTNTENLMQTAQDFDIDMDSAADKAIRLIDKIIYGEKVRSAGGGGPGALTWTRQRTRPFGSSTRSYMGRRCAL